MKKLYWVLLTTLLTSLQLTAQTWEWTKTTQNGINNPNPPSDNDDDAPYEIVTDSEGFIYTLGDYYDTLYLANNFITKGFGSYLAKYDTAGNLIWYQLIRKTGTFLNNWEYRINASDIVLNSTGIFIVGFIPTNPFKVPATYEIGSSSFIVDTTGSYIYGYPNEFFVCHINFNGTVVWNKTSRHAGGLGNNYRPTITSDNNNNIIVSGFKGNNLCGPCGKYQTTFYTGTDAVTDNTGRPYREQIFILKYSSIGNLLWSSYIKDNLLNAGAGYPVSLACDNSNNIWLYAGIYNGSYFNSIQFTSPNGTLPLTVLTKLNSSGTFQFVKEIATYSSGDRVYRFGKPQLITFDNADNLYALVNLSNQPDSYLDGSIPISSERSQKIYLLKYNNSANLIWYRTFGSKQKYGDDYASDIKFYNNALWYTGSVRSYYSFQDTSYFNFNPLTVPDKRISNSYLKFFAAKSDTAGNFNWVTTFSGSGGMIGLGIAPASSGIYTSCAYSKSINDLGSLGGSFINPNMDILNQFFGKLKDQYIRVGAISAKQVMPGCNISIPFTSTGLTFSAKNKFTAELSNASGDFTTPTIIGSVKSTGSGSINAVVPATLAVGTSGYKIRIRSTDTLLTGFNYFAYADTGYTLTITCPGVAGGQTTTNITGTTATLNWAAVGCAAGYKIQYRVKGTTAWTTQNTTGNITSLALTGLTINTTYQWRMATKCKNGTTTSFSAYSPNQQFKTAAAIIASAENALKVVENEKKIWVQPNPAVNNSTVIFTASQANSKYTIQLTDLSGKTIWHKEGITVKGTNSVSLSLSKFAKSMYLVHVLINGEKDLSAMLYKN